MKHQDIFNNFDAREDFVPSFEDDLEDSSLEEMDAKEAADLRMVL